VLPGAREAASRRGSPRPKAETEVRADPAKQGNAQTFYILCFESLLVFSCNVTFPSNVVSLKRHEQTNANIFKEVHNVKQTRSYRSAGKP
jgi:hypothetical protein